MKYMLCTFQKIYLGELKNYIFIWIYSRFQPKLCMRSHLFPLHKNICKQSRFKWQCETLQNLMLATVF
jgi:hypothetical protein